MGGLTQRPWTPTKRRGPIAAEFSGPGPACVTLPTTFGKSFKGKDVDIKFKWFQRVRGVFLRVQKKMTNER